MFYEMGVKTAFLIFIERMGEKGEEGWIACTENAIVFLLYSSEGGA